jgi:hypothetical protein
VRTLSTPVEVPAKCVNRDSHPGFFNPQNGQYSVVIVLFSQVSDLFAHSKLYNNLDCLDGYFMAYQLFPPLINLSKLVSLFIEFSFLVGKFSLLNHCANAL